MKKIVTIMGSPHLNGNIKNALKSIEEGANKNKIVHFDLVKLNIKNCMGCRKCVYNGGVCVIKDDFEEIFEEIKNCDVLIIGSPIYICQINGITKTFLDRLYPLTDEKHKPRFLNADLYMLYCYGAPVPFIFNKYIKYTGKSLKAMGINIKKNIVIHGCTTTDKVLNSEKIKMKMKKIGEKI